MMNELLESLMNELESFSYSQGIDAESYDEFQQEINNIKYKIHKLFQHNPHAVLDTTDAPVWRDGAVEQWGAESEEGYYWKWKVNTPQPIQYSERLPDAENWPKILWLHKFEFPMAAMPEPVIEPCPFCGGECSTLCDNNGIKDNWWLFCFGHCGYTSGFFDTEQEAIDAHNKIARGEQ
jgi:hypothetical protein